MADSNILALAQKVWDYMHMNHMLEKADCIFVLGSHDLRVAERGAELYLKGWAPLLIFSGGLGNFTKGVWTEKEADKFAAIAVKMGVPREVIITENMSSNTGENVQFTKALLSEKGIHPQSFIVVQKPFMERRAYATFEHNWPGKKLMVTSPQISFTDYPGDLISVDYLINVLVGDLQRIKVYPEKGFQVYQEIPGDVWDAYGQLVAAGYDKHLIK